MNELVLKSTGKEFHIVNELLKFIKHSGCVFISIALTHWYIKWAMILLS